MVTPFGKHFETKYRLQISPVILIYKEMDNHDMLCQTIFTAHLLATVLTSGSSLLGMDGFHMFG